MKRLLWILAFSIACVSASAQTGSKQENAGPSMGISAAPARLLFKLDRGKIEVKPLTITNGTDRKQTIVLSFMDWSRDTVGEHTYLGPGKSRHSCANWVSFDRPSLELEPGSKAVINVTMKVPDSAEAVSEMKWTMLILQNVAEKSVPTKGKIMGAQVKQSLALGVHITQVPPAVTNKEMKMISFEEVPGRGLYRVICKNIGGVELYAKCTLELSSENGVKKSYELQQVPLFPDQERYMDFPIPKDMPKGKVTAVALVDANDDDIPIEAAQKEFVIK